MVFLCKKAAGRLRKKIRLLDIRAYLEVFLTKLLLMLGSSLVLDQKAAIYQPRIARGNEPTRMTGSGCA